MSVFSKHGYWIFTTALLALGLAWIWISRAPHAAVTGGRIPAAHAGFLAPDFELTSAEGQAVRLSDLRGKPVIVNVWASWCAPCRAEMPALERVHQEYAGELALLGVNSTSQDSRPAALNFAAEQGLTFPILFDDDGEVARLYGVRALPTTFFIDAEGVIREVITGGPMAESLLRVRVEQLLRRSAGFIPPCALSGSAKNLSPIPFPRREGAPDSVRSAQDASFNCAAKNAPPAAASLSLPEPGALSGSAKNLSPILFPRREEAPDSVRSAQDASFDCVRTECQLRSGCLRPGMQNGAAS